MGVIDRRRVKHSFGRQAHEYDRHADVQKRVITRFMEIMPPMEAGPDRILDLGTGTGMLLCRLSGVFPGACLVGIDLAPEMSLMARQKMPRNGNSHSLSADAEQLPFADGSFDLIVSTSTFQWLDKLDSAFREALRVLRPGGRFFFAMFGESTLFELKNSYRGALATFGRQREDRAHNFHSVREAEESLARAGFGGCRVMSEKYVEYHENVPSLLRSLKKIGAGSAAGVGLRGLAGRRVMQDMIESYVRIYGSDGMIPATYEVIYAMGKSSL